MVDNTLHSLFWVLTKYRPAFELLLRDKRQLRCEFVNFCRGISSIWRQLPPDSPEEDRLAILKGLIQKYSEEVSQNLSFIDKQILDSIAQVLAAESKTIESEANESARRSSQQANIENEYDEKISKLESKHSECLDKVKRYERELRSKSEYLRRIANDLADIRNLAINAETESGKWFGNEEEVLKKLPGEIESVIDKIRGLYRS
jgi:hypothetical protein